MRRPPSQVMRFDHLFPSPRCAGAQDERPALVADRQVCRCKRLRERACGCDIAAAGPPRGMHTRSASLRSCRSAFSCRFVAPLALTGTQGCSIQRHDAAHAEDESGEDTNQREQGAGMHLTVQPLARHESQSHADRERDAELRRNSERLRGCQPGPFETWGR